VTSAALAREVASRVAVLDGVVSVALIAAVPWAPW
jgi:hypothetical protein